MVLLPSIYTIPKKVLTNSIPFLVFSIIYFMHKFKLMLFLLFSIFIISIVDKALIRTDIFYLLKWAIFFVFVIFELIIFKFDKWKLSFRSNYYKLPIIFFAIYIFLFSFFSMNIKTSLFKSITLIFLIFFSFVIIPEITKTKNDKENILKLIKNIFLFIIVLNGILLILSPRWAYDFWGVRFSGIFFNPNELGVILFVSLPIFCYYLLTSKRKINRILNFIVTLLIFIITIFTFSRASMLGMFISIMVILYYVKKKWFRIFLVAFIVFSIVLLSSPVTMQILRLSDNPLTYRDKIWKAGLSRFSDQKIIGNGYGTSKQIMSNRLLLRKYDINKWHLGLHFHNIYIEVLCETGIIGFALFLSFLIFVMCKFIKKIRISNGEEKIFTICCYSLFGGAIFHGFFESMMLSAGNISNIIFWTLIGISLQSNNLEFYYDNQSISGNQLNVNKLK